MYSQSPFPSVAPRQRASAAKQSLEARLLQWDLRRPCLRLTDLVALAFAWAEVIFWRKVSSCQYLTLPASEFRLELPSASTEPAPTAFLQKLFLSRPLHPQSSFLNWSVALQQHPLSPLSAPATRLPPAPLRRAAAESRRSCLHFLPLAHSVSVSFPRLHPATATTGSSPSPNFQIHSRSLPALPTASPAVAPSFLLRPLLPCAPRSSPPPSTILHPKHC
mmetsp:Transcript_382/g.1284  ORF Transcript_382/g.1284 Transcript_382/m.1284 type:complete len:220 (+) Transcript_382:1085-1744(+)